MWKWPRLELEMAHKTVSQPTLVKTLAKDALFAEAIGAPSGNVKTSQLSNPERAVQSTQAYLARRSVGKRTSTRTVMPPCPSRVICDGYGVMTEVGRTIGKLIGLLLSWQAVVSSTLCDQDGEVRISM